MTATTTYYYDGIYVDILSNNYTLSLGSEILLLCKNETNEGGVFRAVCQESGLWLPDLSEYKCTDQSSELSSPVIDFNNA